MSVRVFFGMWQEDVAVRKAVCHDLPRLRWSYDHWVSPLRDVLLSVSGRPACVIGRNPAEELVCHWTESAEGWLESVETNRLARVAFDNA